MKCYVKLNGIIVENIVSVDLEKNKITYIPENTHYPYWPTTIQCEPGEITLEKVENEQIGKQALNVEQKNIGGAFISHFNPNAFFSDKSFNIATFR